MKFDIRQWLRDEDGAVTVDWVVLTAAMAGFGLAIVMGISEAATDPADSLEASLAGFEVGFEP